MDSRKVHLEFSVQAQKCRRARRGVETVHPHSICDTKWPYDVETIRHSMARADISRTAIEKGADPCSISVCFSPRYKLILWALNEREACVFTTCYIRYCTILMRKGVFLHRG